MQVPEVTTSKNEAEKKKKIYSTTVKYLIENKDHI